MDEVNTALRRLPVYLVIDTSSAMAGEAMALVRKAVSGFLDDLQMDPQALELVWLSVITFDSEARQLVPLTEIYEFVIPDIRASASGDSSLGAAFRLLSECIERDHRKTTSTCKSDYEGVVLLMSLGEPTDRWELAYDELKYLIDSLVTCAAGPHANESKLKRISTINVILENFEYGLLARYVDLNVWDKSIRLAHPSWVPRNKTLSRGTSTRFSEPYPVDLCTGSEDVNFSLRRLPVYLVLDTSSTMAGEPMELVRKTVRGFLDDLQNNPQVLELVWLSVITFDREARQLVPLTAIEEFVIPDICASASGESSLGAALNLLMDCADREFLETTSQVKGDWKSVIFLMTDGASTDSWEKAADKLKKRRLGNIIGCAAGPDADDTVLKRITETVFRLEDTSAGTFGAFFCWPGVSIQSVKENDSFEYKEECSLPPPPERLSIAPQGSIAIVDDGKPGDSVMRRLPVYLVLDTSSSMAGEPIEALRNGMQSLLDDLQTDPQALETVCLSVITFDRDARQLVPLTAIDECSIPDLCASSSGDSSLGAALNLVMDCVDREMRDTTSEAKGDYQALIFLMTSSMPTDHWERAADKMKQSRLSRVIGCAAGPGAHDAVLKRITEIVVRLENTSAGTLGAFMAWTTVPIKATQEDDPSEDTVESVHEVPAQSCSAILSDGTTIEYVDSDNPPQDNMMEVYFSKDRKSALSFYKDESLGNDADEMARLESIVGRYNPTITRADGGAAASQQSADYFKNLFCWPAGIIVKPARGVLMPIYPDNFFFSKGRFKGKNKEGMWFTSPKLRKLIPPGEAGDWLGFLKICTRMARAVAQLHKMGCAHADLSAKNLLIDPSSGSCSVLGVLDCLVTHGLPPQFLGTPGYMAPEVLASLHLSFDDPERAFPNDLTNLHALAVLIYEYLLKRHPLRGPKINSSVSSEEDEHLSMGSKALFIEHPSDQSNRPGKNARDPSWKQELGVTIDDLGPYLSKCFKQTFVDGLHNPRSRVTAEAWVDALCKTQDLIIPCGNNACLDKWFVYNEGQQICCPWCGTKLIRETPVLDLHDASQPGKFCPQNHSVVAWDKRTLYEWHVYSDKRMDENSDTKGLTDVQFYNGQWILINRELDSMVSASGNPVPKGQAVVLKEGDEILLSEAEHGQLISVRMIG